MRRLNSAGSAIIVVLSFGSFLSPESAAAAEQGAFSKLPWNWDPWILVTLAVALIAYFWGLRGMHPVPRSRTVGAARVLSFVAGIAFLFLVLITPFDALDDELFSAHMLQHLVLMMIAPPLLVFGRPEIALLWAAPSRTRRSIGRFWMNSGFRSLVRFIMSPLFVWLLCSGMLWFWHLPANLRRSINHGRLGFGNGCVPGGARKRQPRD